MNIYFQTVGALFSASYMKCLQTGLILILLSQSKVIADDRTLHVGIFGFLGNSPTATIVSVTAGSVSNQTPSGIAFYIESSDDLVNWKPYHVFDPLGTNSEPTIVTNLTNGQMALFLDETVSAHRFYRAVATQ